jgi:hypothetical protein
VSQHGFEHLRFLTAKTLDAEIDLCCLGLIDILHPELKVFTYMEMSPLAVKGCQI